MAEDKIVTTSTSSDGTVTITVEKYQELLRESAAKAPIVQKIVQKTPEMAASDNKAWGVTFIGLGIGMTLIGIGRLRTGIAQAKALVK
jgi:hypothetical protein